MHSVVLLIRSAAGASVSLCACERVTSDFEGIARVKNYVAQKKNGLIRSLIIIRLARLKNNLTRAIKKTARAIKNT